MLKDFTVNFSNFKNPFRIYIKKPLIFTQQKLNCQIMKRLFLPLSALIALSVNVSAQSARIFAVTGDAKGNVTWNAFREISSADGALKSTIYSPSSKQPLNYQSFSNRNVTPTAEPAISAVAASAYDAKTHRLYYTNMRGNTLNYIDLNENGLTVVSNEDAVFNTGDKFKTEANIITRMTFGADGAGYALSNDAEHLIRFTTENKSVVTDLGRLIDGANNGANSIHNNITSWGGDMVGDAFGNLYVLNMHNAVYKVNTHSLVADYVGTIKGLPEGFTTNGAAVDENGDLIVSSAIYTSSYFKVDFASLTVTAPIKGEGGVYNASDLASSNLLYQSKVTAPELAVIKEHVSVYPNPAVGKVFQLKVTSPENDKYSVKVTNISGKAVYESTINGNSSFKVNLPQSLGAGLYFIKVTNTAKQTIYNEKVVVE